MRSLRPSEQEIQRSILELLRLERVYAIRLNTGRAWINDRPIDFHSGGKGVADIVAFIPSMREHEPPAPRVLWIEVKSPKGRQTMEQASFEAHVKSLGMFYIVARGLEDVLAWLRDPR